MRKTEDWGYREGDEQRQEEFADMSFPVLCLMCHNVYDLGMVTVTARYADCSCWNTPCCDQATDSRYEMQANGRASGWVGGSPTYRNLTRREVETGMTVGRYGEMGWLF